MKKFQIGKRCAWWISNFDIFKSIQFFRTPVRWFGGKIENKHSFVFLSPCCAEFQYCSIHQMKRMVEGDNNEKVFILFFRTPVSPLGGKIENKLSFVF